MLKATKANAPLISFKTSLPASSKLFPSFKYLLNNLEDDIAQSILDL